MKAQLLLKIGEITEGFVFGKGPVVSPTIIIDVV